MKTEAWTAAQHALWARIAAHPFSDRAQRLDFTARLAREQGYSRKQAEAAIGEYRRFCFLAIAAGHAVTPSAEVDEVWHLHLTYSRDYWQQFCPAVLGTELHHGPTVGGAQAGAQYREQYAATLASYARFFGPPPPAFWPAAGVRFGNPARFRRVDVSAVWLLPKPRWPGFAGLRRRWPALALLLPLPLAAADSLNPFLWEGPAFLGLYILLLLIAMAGLLLSRRVLHGGGLTGQHAGLTPYELAYLVGGPQRVLDTATAELLAGGYATVDAERGCLLLSTEPKHLPKPLNLYAPLLTNPKWLRNLPAKQHHQLQPLANSLLQRGLLIDEEARQKQRLQPRLVLGALAAFGFIKVIVGIGNQRPVGFLLALLAVTWLFAWLMARRSTWRSEAGDRAVEDLRRSHSHLLLAPGNQNLGLAVALGAGAAAFTGTAYAAVLAYKPAASDMDAGSSFSTSDASISTGADGSSSGDSGGDSGGSGCGGCGGGGGD